MKKAILEQKLVLAAYIIFIIFISILSIFSIYEMKTIYEPKRRAYEFKKFQEELGQNIVIVIEKGE